jgi:uncharacterized protein with von Willebrand factor type A (vWA) domain
MANDKGPGELPPAAQRVLERARRLFLLRDLRSVVAGADRLSYRAWAQGVEGCPSAAEENERAARTLGGEPVRDAFFLVTAPAPQLVETPPEGTEALHRLLGEAMATPGFQRLREAAGDDPVVAAYGAAAWVQELLAQLPQGVREVLREAAAQEEREKAQEELSRLQAILSSLEERGQSIPPELQERVQQAQERLQALREEAEAKTALAMAALREREAEVRAALSHAAAAAATEAREFEASVRGFDLSAGGEGRVSPQAARAWKELLVRLPHLRQLARELGWARRLVAGLYRQSPRGRTEMVGYRLEAPRPEEMAPWELALMMGPAPARLDFFRRAAEGEVWHRRFQGRERMGRGPLVVVRDESGSMQGAPHTLAVALEWALLEICRRERRPFVSICFSGPGQVRLFRAPERPDHRGLLAHLSHFYGGGTEPYQALVLALQEVERAPELRRADILLISDARFSPPPREVIARLEETRRRRPLRVAAILVGAEPGPLGRLASPVVRVQDLLRERDALATAIAAVV